MTATEAHINAEAAMPPIAYTFEEAERAHEEWKASCGPHSIAAATGKTLEEVRAYLPQPHKGWMNPIMIRATFYAMAQRYTYVTGLKTKELCRGINRLQFEGSWLNPGVPAAAAYAHTHYVARMGDGVLDAMIVPHVWIPIEVFFEWHRLHGEPFHITHHWILP